MLAETGSLFKQTFQEWKDDDAMQFGAALAYYSALSLAPLLVLLLAILGLVWQGPQAEQRLLTIIEQQAGEQAGEAARLVLTADAEERGSGLLAGTVSVLFLLVGASGVFGQLRKALNRMWEVEAADGGISRFLKSRAMGIAMVIGLGALLLAALVVQTTLSAVAGDAWMSIINQIGSVVLFTVVFGAVFRTLPDVKIGWREVWGGAAATAVLFTVGQLLVGLYLSNSSVGSRYGAAGTLVAFLVWLYYSAQVFFFGAELTQVGARRYGKALEPEKGARRVREMTVALDEEEGGGGDGRPDPGRTTVRGEASYP